MRVAEDARPCTPKTNTLLLTLDDLWFTCAPSHDARQRKPEITNDGSTTSLRIITNDGCRPRQRYLATPIATASTFKLNAESLLLDFGTNYNIESEEVSETGL